MHRCVHSYGSSGLGLPYSSIYSLLQVGWLYYCTRHGFLSPFSKAKIPSTAKYVWDPFLMCLNWEAGAVTTHSLGCICFELGTMDDRAMF